MKIKKVIYFSIIILRLLYLVIWRSDNVGGTIRLPVEQNVEVSNPQPPETQNETWSQIAKKSIDAEKSKQTSNDRCFLEHQRPE